MRMRRKYLAARLPLPVRLVLAFAAVSVSAFENDFSKYPTGSQQCLTDSANASGCNGSTVQEMNQCLCGNSGNFVTNAAACIKKSDSADLETVYTTMADACNYSNTPLAVSQNDFMNAGSSSSSSPTTVVSTVSGGHTTTITTAETTTPTVTTITTVSNGQTVTLTTPLPASTTSPPPSTGGGTGDGGMSSTAKIGIIAGAAVAGAAILAAIIFFFLRHRRARHRGPRDESHPMLPQKIGGGFGPGGGGGGDTSYPNSSLGDRTSAYGVPAGEWKHDGADAKWHPSPGPWSASAATPTPTPHQQQWDAGQQYHSGWQAQQAQHPNWGYNPGAPYAPAHPSHPIPAQPVELAGPEPPKPVEMPASPMPHSATSQYSTQYPTQGWTSYNGR